jgi:hypothetical protein
MNVGLLQFRILAVLLLIRASQRTLRLPSQREVDTLFAGRGMIIISLRMVK